MLSHLTSLFVLSVYDDVAEGEITEDEHAPDSYVGELAAIKKSFTEAAKEHDQQFKDDDGVESLLKTKKVSCFVFDYIVYAYRGLGCCLFVDVWNITTMRAVLHKYHACLKVGRRLSILLLKVFML